MRFLLPLCYSRHRRYRHSSIGHRLPPLYKKWWNHPMVNLRFKPNNRCRDTFIQYNARACKHNRGED